MQVQGFCVDVFLIGPAGLRQKAVDVTMRGKSMDQANSGPITNVSPGERRQSAGHSETLQSTALKAAGIAIYEWDIESDAVTWSGGIESLLVADGADRTLSQNLETGRAYARLVDPDTGLSRYDAVMTSEKTDRGDGVPFECEYVITLPGSGKSIWIEDCGSWFVGGNGRPGRVIGTVRNVTARKTEVQRLARLAQYDDLTGHVNRVRLRELLSQTIAFSERFDRDAAFMMAGIDNLTLINEAYGFDVADQVIVAVAKRLKTQLRQSDTLGRVSGNKFGIILTNCGEAEMAYTAERLMQAVRDTVIDTGAGPVSATVSVGCVAIPRCARNAGEALARSEEVLGAAKSTRQGAYAIYQLSEQRESSRRRNVELADQITAAMNEDRLCLAYQPIVSTKTGEAELYECLLRLRRADGEVVSAGEFIPVAEKLGLVRLIDQRVLEMAMKTLEDYPQAELAINVSGMTATDGTWLQSMIDYVGERRDLASRLIVEITETVALHELEESAKFVRELRNLGCRVAIDDFGAGYTSFRNLKALDVDMVKIDGSFIKGLVRNRDDQLFVQTLVHLAKNFNLPVVAEWVGNEDEVTLLRAYGVEYMQGFFLGEPVLDLPWKTDASQRETA